LAERIRRHGPFLNEKRGLEPMTAALGYALIKLAIDHDEEAKHLMARCDNELEQLWLSRFIAFRPEGLLVDPQKPIGPYRVDFAIDNRLVVEIDGYQYHRQTRDQLVYEYRRDRELTMLGWTVIHFGGIEVWEDPEGCARSVLKLADPDWRSCSGATLAECTAA